MQTPQLDDEPYPSVARPTHERRRMIFWGVVAGVGVLLVLLLLCLTIGGLIFLARTGMPRLGQSLPPPPEAPTPPPELLPVGRIRLHEDFNMPTPIWDQSGAAIRAGVYALRLDTPHSKSYGLYLGEAAVQDFDMSVDATQTGGDLSAEYGIRFRQHGPDDFLIFSISSSGYYRLARVQDDGYTSLVPWTADGVIRRGLNSTNRLRVVARGQRIEGYINDTLVLTVDDPQPVAGQLTLGLGTFAVGELAVAFDNLAGTAEGQPLQEDFTDPATALWSQDSAQIADGQYVLAAAGTIQTWRQPLPAPAYAVDTGSFVLEVEATLQHGHPNSAYGVIFGDGGAFDFYVLYVLPDQRLTILQSDPQVGTLVLLPPMRVPALNPGNGTNHLRIAVRGPAVQLTINGADLPALRSEVPITGQAGMIVSSGDPLPTVVQFDNFLLEELPAQDDDAI